jgi:uncharacterized membrane protein
VRAETVHQLLLLGIILGLAFSLYAGYESTHPAAQGTCTLNGYVSCAKIDTSGHTTTLGIEDWLWGAGGFVLLLLLDIPLYRTWKREWLLPLTALSTVGVLLSLYFAYLEFAVIQGLCIICLGAYLSNVLVFGCAAYLMRLGSAERKAAAAGADASS